MKKDLLFGMNGSRAVIVGIVLWIINKVIYIEDSHDILLMTLFAMLEAAAFYFFIIGLYRWNKEIRERKQKKNEPMP